MDSIHLHGDEEARLSESGDKPHRGGWNTFFFMTGTVAGTTVSASGWSVNLIVYLMDEFNIKSVDAAQISNVVNGCISLFPVIGAVIADSFGFLNRAALKTEGDLRSAGSIAKPWRLCSVQQLEDVKSILRIIPLLSSSILLASPIVVEYAMVVLQALTMDRHLGPYFKIPPGSFLVIVLLSTAIFLSIIDRILFPMWQKLTSHCPTTFQRIGIGHVFNVLGMAISALVEGRRLNIVKSHHLQDQPGAVVPMLSLWLFPQLVAVGIGEAFHFPGQVALYYQEFPPSLKNTATAMVAMVVGIAYYAGTGLIDVVRRNSDWLPDNINTGRVDNLYWLLVVVGVINFGYYLVCAKLYNRQVVVEVAKSRN